MSEQNEEEALSAWEKDVDFLVNILKESFESTEVKYSVDEHNNILYVELEGLQDYPDDEIVEIAEPIFETADLDFEDIILLPLS
ncbi:hypothetical protein [Rhodohalobacter barkolensis]|uniref:Uncharacterized protein n=1 Tax=Rhodohalobacter barkolensis TaxID=2053187 RepID=A0A2N0VF38_9BACT|nr:hypothetical protein [Rhodohalobacter barkolensis]PKD42797.1 hypothetical protein CWD77_13160 [Rhodohalobacter barkolensis]